MTIKFTEGTTIYNLFFNVGNISTSLNAPGNSRELKIISQWSNTAILEVPFTITVGNSRYFGIEFPIDVDFPKKHKNGMYNYEVIINNEIIDSGILKIVTNPGGEEFTESYTSNNENRATKVYYRPEY